MTRMGQPLTMLVVIGVALVGLLGLVVTAEGAPEGQVTSLQAVSIAPPDGSIRPRPRESSPRSCSTTRCTTPW